MALTLGRCWLLADALAQLVRQPELHADEGLPTLLRQLAPWLGPRQHVAHAALGQPQHLGTTDVSPTSTGLLPALGPHAEGGCHPSLRLWSHGMSKPLGLSHRSWDHGGPS